MQRNVMKGAVIAAAMAGFLSAGVATVAHAGNAEVKCAGANSCKGSGSCKSASNECKGKNGCKGQGWIHVKDEAECKAKGGSVVK
jgi:uncharacterized membrane protein